MFAQCSLPKRNYKNTSANNYCYHIRRVSFSREEIRAESIRVHRCLGRVMIEINLRMEERGGGLWDPLRLHAICPDESVSFQSSPRPMIPGIATSYRSSVTIIVRNLLENLDSSNPIIIDFETICRGSRDHRASLSHIPVLSLLISHR